MMMMMMIVTFNSIDIIIRWMCTCVDDMYLYSVNSSILVSILIIVLLIFIVIYEMQHRGKNKERPLQSFILALSENGDWTKGNQSVNFSIQFKFWLFGNLYLGLMLFKNALLYSIK